MLATAGPLPRGPGWAFELKWDGVRALADLSAGRTRLLARSGTDITVAYPELAGLAEELGRDALLDGEVVVLRADASTDFTALQSRMHVNQAGRAAALARTQPVTYLVFDLLRLDGLDLTALPYEQRRQRLESLGLAGPSWQVPPAFGLDPSTGGDGGAVLAASSQLGLEGVVAKRLGSPYQPGRRSEQWIKVKNVRTQAVVIGGWTPGQGGRARSLGSLLTGLPVRVGDQPAARPVTSGDAPVLRYAGNVGSGFTDASVRDLRRQLDELASDRSPFDGSVDPRHARLARWVHPVLVGEVAFAHWTPDGRLRHPVWRGLRPDLTVADVVPE